MRVEDIKISTAQLTTAIQQVRTNVAAIDYLLKKSQTMSESDMQRVRELLANCFNPLWDAEKEATSTTQLCDEFSQELRMLADKAYRLQQSD